MPTEPNKRLGWAGMLLTILLLPAAGTAAQGKDTYAKARAKMVKYQLEERDVTDKRVLQAMYDVKRHLFVPRHSWSQAYKDHPLSIGEGQTISQPYMVAIMTQLVKPDKKAKALEIGTGSAYQAAILSELVDKVYSVEIREKLGKKARKRLKELDYKNVETKIADGYYGWEKKAPFDIIMVTCAIDHIPQPLVKQLADGGRLVIPVGSPYLYQSLMIVEKKGEKTTSRFIMYCRFVPMKHEKKEEQEDNKTRKGP